MPGPILLARAQQKMTTGSPSAKALGNPPALMLVWRLATSDGVPARSLKVALVVGTALNLINQGDALFGSGAINWFKLMLTFAMPYLVSTYGAVSVRWDAAKAREIGAGFSD